MKTKLPTEPGPYFWRKKEGDEWIPCIIYSNQHGLWAYFHDELASNRGATCVRHMSGQWAKCARPNEGQEAWAVLNPDKEIIVFTVSDTPQRAINRHAVSSEDTWSKREAIGYTCEPVTIHRRNKEQGMSMTQQQINVDLFDQCKRLQAENVNVSDALKAAYKEIGHLEKELATLRAKAEAWDKGGDVWAVVTKDGIAVYIGTRRQCIKLSKEYNESSIFQDGYTCRKVRVCEVVG